MTVGLAAIARGGKAIVMMADRRLTYGTDLHTESWRPKILSVAGTWHALWAGSPTLAQAVVGSIDPHEENPGRALHMSLRKRRDTDIDETVLRPRMLTRNLYIERPATLQPLNDTYRSEIDKEIRDYSFDCKFLLCGFIPDGAMVATIDETGVEHAFEGFAAIGSGDRAAMSALIFSELDPKDDIDVQLYQLLYAKAHAEMTPFVGYELDAWIFTAERGLVEVDRDIVGTEDSLVDRVLENATKSPFKPRAEWKARPGYEAPRRPPPGWERRLKDYVDRVAGQWPSAAS